MIVVDCNVLAYFFLSGKKTDLAHRLIQREPVWSAPARWRSEFSNVLALYLRREIIDLDRAHELSASAETIVGAFTFDVPPPAVLALVSRSSCTAYDCEYVALAVDLGVRLLTEDQKVLEQFPSIATNMETYLGEVERDCT